MKDIADVDRPREKLAHNGPESLSNEEILAILLRTGTSRCSVLDLSRKAIATAGGFKALSGLNLQELERIDGIGKAKACQLLAAMELGRRLTSYTDAKTLVQSPADAARVVSGRLFDQRREVFGALLLNTKNEVISVETVSIGTLNASLVHPREVFNPAIRKSSNAVLLFHNHPSGNTSPSQEDRKLTARLVEAGKLLGIEVLDHIVVGENAYYSFKEHGHLE